MRKTIVGNLAWIGLLVGMLSGMQSAFGSADDWHQLNGLQEQWFEDHTIGYVIYVTPTYQADFSCTFLGNTIPFNNSATCTTTAFGEGVFRDTYGKETVSFSGSKVTKVHFAVSPKVYAQVVDSRGPGANVLPFRVLVDGEEKSEWDEVNPLGGNCANSFSKTFTIEIRPDQGPRPAGAGDTAWSRVQPNLSSESVAGNASWLNLGPGRSSLAGTSSVAWGVSVGRLNNGETAGQIFIRKNSASTTDLAAVPAALLFTSTKANQPDVTVLRSAGVLRQVKAPQVFADIVTTGSNSYEIRFYLPGQVGALGGDGFYTVSGSPFVTYQFSSASSVLKITELRNQASYVSDLQYASGTQIWTLQTGSGSDTKSFTRTVTIGTDRTETVEYRNSSSVLAYKAAEHYVDLPESLPWQLKSVTLDPAGSQLTTTYEYYESADFFKWGRLLSMIYPDGSWEKLDYVADPTMSFNGSLQQVLRPWKDSPTTPTGATTANSHIADYEFGELATGQPYVNKITNSFKASQTDARSWTRLEGFPEAASGSDLREEKYLVGVSDIGDMVTSKSYTDANPTKAGLPYSERYQNGTRKSFYYETGTYDAGTRVFTPGSGTDWRMTSVTGGAAGILSGDASSFEGKTIEPLHIIPNQSIKQTKVIRQGNVLLRENYIVSAYDASTGSSTTELLDQFIYTNDSLGHATNVVRRDPVTGATRTIYSCDWRSPSNNQDGDLKMSETDEFGTQTSYTYDGLKRVKTVTKKGIAAGGGFAAQSDIVTTFTYDAMDRVLTRVVSSGGLSLTTSYTYDLAGRLVSETSPEGLTTGYSYANGGRTTTITYPNSGTQIIDKYLDGRIKSITGTAVVNRFYDYGQTFDTGTGTFSPKNTTIETIGTSTSTRQKTYVTDLREVLTEERVPGALGATLVHDLAFNSFGQLTTVERPTPNNTGIIRTLNEYDATGNLMGNVARTGLDVSPTTPAQFTLASTDRIYESSVVYEKISGSFYLKSTGQKYLTDNSATPTVAAIRRERVTGLGTNIRSEITLIDADNNSTIVTTTLEVANKKATTVINTAQSTLDATSITVNGLLQSASTPTVATATLYTYDGLGRQIGVTNPLGFKAGTTFHASTGQVIATTNFMGQVTAYEYYPQSNAGAGRLKTQTEPDGKKSYFEYSLRDELTHKWGDVPYPEERTYDTFGQLTEVHTYRTGTASDWKSASWPGASFAHDDTKFYFQESTGLLTSQQDALARSINYTYYANNLFKNRAWARGTNVTFNISDLGDVTGLDYSDATPDVTYGNFDRTGRPRSITDATGAHTLTYDYAQRLTQDAATSGAFSGITLINHFNTTFGRDYLQLQITGQSTIQHDFSYDTYGRLSTAGYGLYSGNYGYLANSDLLQTTTYKNNGAAKLTTTRTWQFGSRVDSINNVTSGTVTSEAHLFDTVNRRYFTRLESDMEDKSKWFYTFDDRRQLTQAERQWMDSTPVAGQQFTFSYDSIGNRTQHTDGGDANGGNLRTTTYALNAANQYTSLTIPSAVDIQGVAYANATVTVNGNAAYRKGEYYCYALPVSNSSAPVAQSVTVTASQGGNNNTVTGTVLVPKSSTTLSYDLDGNLTYDGLWNYTYDAENRLIQIESDTAITSTAKRKLVFTYDHAGRRATKKVYLWSGSAWSSTPSLDLKMVYDGRRLLAELDATSGANNAPQRSYLWGQDLSGTLEGSGGIGGLVLERQHTGSDAGYYFPGYDSNGNVTALVNAVDQTIAARYDYAPFGKPLRATGNLGKTNPLRFSTKPHDEETGLASFSARYYHPDLGRWVSRDPFGFAGGPNLYGYTGNRPVGGIDPWGMFTIQDALAAQSSIAILSQMLLPNLTRGGGTRTGLDFSVITLPGQLGGYSLRNFYKIWEQSNIGWDEFDFRFHQELSNATQPYPFGRLSEWELWEAYERGYIDWWQMPVNPVVGENGGLIVTFTAGDLAIIAATTAVEALGPAMQGITRGFPRFSVLAARATAETVTIYRGVGQTINGITPNPAYRAALEGRAIPRGWPKGVDNPAAHVGGATENSIYTSWTLERSVALDYATENGNGVILSRTIPRSELGPIWQNYNEAEILIRGPVTGATPTRVRGF